MADLQTPQLRLLALEGVVTLLHEIVRSSRGVLLVVDDLHQADPDSLEVLRYVSAAVIDGLGIVGALRPAESDVADELVRVSRTLPRTTVLDVEPLGARAVGELIGNLLDATVRPELVDAVLARTDGVPLLVEEVTEAYVRAGSVVVEATGAAWRGDATVVPRSVRGMVDARLQLLSEPSREVITAAALLGDFQSTDLLATVADADEHLVSVAIRQALDARLAVARGGSLTFRHDIIREAVVDATPAHVLTTMHRRAAAALTSPADLQRRALHLEGAGDLDAAAEALTSAASSELAAHALLSAERLARRAQQLARADQQRAAAADALASVLVAQGRWAEALALDQSTVESSGETRARRQRMASAALEAGFNDLARTIVEGASDDLPLTHLLSGRIALVGGDAARAQAEAESVLATDVDVDTRLAALDLRARALDFQGERRAAEESWTLQASEAAAAGKTQTELRAVFQLGKLDFFDGRRPVRLRQAVDLARSAGALLELSWAEETLAIALVLQGDPAAALQVLDTAIPRARALGLDQLAFLLLARAGALSFLQPSVDDLFREVEFSNAAPDLDMMATSLRADIAMHHGRYEEALAHLEQCEQLLASMPGVAPLDSPCYMVWALAALGRLEEARAALARAEAMPDLERWYFRPVLVAAGRALLAGDASGIDAAIAAARGPMPFTVANMRVVAARVLGGDVAIPWLREALDIYERGGAVAYRDRLRQLVRDAGGPVPRRRRTATRIPEELIRHGVTAREAEVLNLLGQGLSNADIGEHLFLSVRTVETHVSSLLAKLDVRSRGQLTALCATLVFES
jgi:DNA-binding CsgD family transcriptional regulator